MEGLNAEALQEVRAHLVAEDVQDGRIGHDVKDEHVDDAEERFEYLFDEVVERTIKTSGRSPCHDVRTRC